MKKLGFQVGIDAIGNVIGVVGEGEPTIFLCGHMDTVAGHLPLRVEEGKIYARGAVDAKGPLAAMVMAAAEVAKEPAFKGKGKILVASVVEEEATSRGVKHLITQGIKADYAIFGEPSGVENITIGYKGQIQLKIVCKTADRTCFYALAVRERVGESVRALGTNQKRFSIRPGSVGKPIQRCHSLLSQSCWWTEQPLLFPLRRNAP